MHYWWMIAALLLVACEQSEEAQRFSVPLGVEPASVAAPFETDLGYEVEVTEMRAVLTGMEFTSKGERIDKSRLSVLGSAALEWVLPTAMAHPGHDGSGVILGELTGRHVVTLSQDEQLGEALLLEGQYSGVNIGLGNSDASDGLEEGSPLRDHAVVIEGEARRGERSWRFITQVSFSEDVRVIDVHFNADLRGGPPATPPRLAASMLSEDGETLFDGVDFEALASDAEVMVIDAEAGEPYFRLRKRLEGHNHWRMNP